MYLRINLKQKEYRKLRTISCNKLIDEAYDGNSEEKNNSRQTDGHIRRESQYLLASVRHLDFCLPFNIP